jgi:hypothetical protein
MTAVTLLLIAGGALALMIGLLVVLIVARKLDGASGGGANLSGQIEKAAATLQATGRGISKLSPGPLGAALSALAARAGDDSKTSTGEGKTAKQIFTGMAIVGGIIALVMGIIAGDG